MLHFDWRSALFGVAVLTPFAAGCVSDNSSPPRSAMWKSHVDGSEEKDWLGRPRDPKASPKLHLAYAKMQEQTGQHDEARKSYEAVLGSDSRSVDAIMGIARLDQLAGRKQEAQQGFEKALRMRPKDPATLDAVGQFYASQNRWREAVEHLNAATIEAPNESTYRYHLACALARSGDVQGALPHFTKSVGEAEAHYNVGYILYEKGNMAEAEKHFLAAVVKRPDLSVAQAMLDEIRHTQGKNEIIPASQEQPRKERRMPLPSTQKPVGSAQRPAEDEQEFGAPPPRRHAGRNPDVRPRSTSYDSSGEPPAWNGGASSEADFGQPATSIRTAEPPAWDGGQRANDPPPFTAAPKQRSVSDPERYGAQHEQWENQRRR